MSPAACWQFWSPALSDAIKGTMPILSTASHGVKRCADFSSLKQGNEKNIMISYEEEIKRFKPSLDVDQIEDAIAKVDLTDMNDIMTSLIEEAIKHKKDESAK